ncbi:hypothetical protein SMICM304S_07702 [Streptomyces microflavus]
MGVYPSGGSSPTATLPGCGSWGGAAAGGCTEAYGVGACGSGARGGSDGCGTAPAVCGGTEPAHTAEPGSHATWPFAGGMAAPSLRHRPPPRRRAAVAPDGPCLVEVISSVVRAGASKWTMRICVARGGGGCRASGCRRRGSKSRSVPAGERGGLTVVRGGRRCEEVRTMSSSYHLLHRPVAPAPSMASMRSWTTAVPMRRGFGREGRDGRFGGRVHGGLAAADQQQVLRDPQAVAAGGRRGDRSRWGRRARRPRRGGPGGRAAGRRRPRPRAGWWRGSGSVSGSWPTRSHQWR